MYNIIVFRIDSMLLKIAQLFVFGNVNTMITYIGS